MSKERGKDKQGQRGTHGVRRLRVRKRNLQMEMEGHGEGKGTCKGKQLEIRKEKWSTEAGRRDRAGARSHHRERAFP